MRPVFRGLVLRGLVLTAVLALPTVLPTPALAQAGTGAPAPVRSAGVRFTAADGELLDVSGVANARRFLDTVELLPRRGGVSVVNELAFDDYLLGLAEVPRSWPEAALDAQVIAARTYAWRSVRRGTFRDYDICATVACQVFRGAEVMLAPGGDRWRAAVERTSGQALVADGEPILARYFSTSGGRTYANEEVFDSSGAFPYLQAIADPYDALSPLHRWEVRFPRAEFDAILAEGRTLSATVPYADVVRLGAADDPQAEVRVTGQDGTAVTVRAIVLRDFVSTTAQRLFPDRFPPPRADGRASLPSTIPTTRFDIEVDTDAVVLHGLGWGHGVGMGQWGAHGRALAGHSAAKILAAYYGGLTPVVDPALPARIRAGMGAADLDDGPVEVRLTAPTLVTTASGAPWSRSLGTWRIDADGPRLTVTPPRGDGETLRLTPTRAYPGVAWGPGRAPGSVHPGSDDATDLRVTSNKPVLLRLEVAGADGRLVRTDDLGLVEAGVHWVRWFHDTAGGARVPAGRYAVRLVGVDGSGDEGGEVTEVVVR